MTIAEQLAEYVRSFEFNDLPPQTIHETKRRIIDALGCFFGSLNTSIMNKLYAYCLENDDLLNSAFFWGTGIRCLDYNDTYLSKEPAHPSDNIAPLLMIAFKKPVTGKELTAAITLAYEIQCRLCDAASLRNRGWDHVSYIPISVACAASRLLNLDKNKTRDAIALAATHGASLRQTRIGELSEWKGAAAACMAKHGLSATLLAQAGVSGPYQVFEGKNGFINQVVKNNFSEEFYNFLKEKPIPRKIEETYIKFYPIEYHIQAVADSILNLRKNNETLQRIENIFSVEIKTYEAAVSIVGEGGEKWNPQTRETADHSIPYIAAIALTDGKISLDQFDQSKIGDENLRPLMKKIKITENAEFTKSYGTSFPAEIIIKTNDGQILSSRTDFPKGHPKNPMSDREIESKFYELSARIDQKEWGIIPVKKIIDNIWDIEKSKKYRLY